MNPREQMLAVYFRRNPDRIPCAAYIRYVPRGEIGRKSRNNGLGLIGYYPIVSLLSPPWHTHAGFESEVRGAELTVKTVWEDNKRVEIRTYITPLGSIFAKIRKDPVYGSDWIKKFYIDSPSDYPVMKYIVENTIFRENYDSFLEIQEDLGSDGVVMARVDRSPFQKMLIELAGPERLFIDLHDNCHLVEDLLSSMEKKLDEAYKIVAHSPAEVIWQPDNITGDMTEPKFFKKYCLPFYNKQGRLFHKHNKAYAVHMDGRLKSLKDLIKRADVDVVESFTFPEGGGNLAFEEARSAWEDKSIIANFPASLCFKKEKAIKEYLQKLLSQLSSKENFMLEISEDLPPQSLKDILPIIVSVIQRQKSYIVNT